MFSDFRQAGLLVNSLSLAGGAALLSIILALPAAFFLVRFKLRFKRTTRVLLLVPILIPPYIHALSWRYLLNNLKIPNYQDLLFTLPAATLILALAYFPIAFFLIENALKNFDANSEDAALLFTSRFKATAKITLPIIAPAIFSSFLFIFLLGLTEFGVPSFLHVNTFVFEIFAQFSAFFNYERAFTLTLPLLITTLIVIAAWFLIIKDRPFIMLSSSSKPLQPIQTTLPARLLAEILLVFLVGLSVFLPLFSLSWQAGNLRSFAFAWASSKPIILTTLWLSALSALFITVLGLLLTIWLHLKAIKGLALYKAARAGWVLFLAIPSITLGVILIRLFNRPLTEAIYTSFWIIVAGFLIRFFSYGMETLNVFWEQIDAKLIEAAQLSGARTARITQKIILPLLAPGLLTVFLITYILSLGELGLTILVYPSGYQTLPIRIFTLLHYGAPELVAALSIILIVSILLLTGAGSIIISKTKQNA